MKRFVICLVILLILAPTQPACAGVAAPKPAAVTITANAVTGAQDIEAAIIRATNHGAYPGTVILDGREGPFVFTEEDKSINIFVSNLTLRGANQAVIDGCDDGLFFDDFPLQHISVEGITFLCSGDGVEASGSFQDVTLRDLIIRAQNNGIGVGGSSSRWTISGNLVQAAGDALSLRGAANMVISDNHLAADNIAVVLMASTSVQVQRNALHAGYQGVLLGQETWRSQVQNNTILGVSASGIALEPGVVRNRVLANSVLCAHGAACLTVDAMPDVAKANTIEGNRP